MNKIKNLILLVVATFMLTGCVKFNANMEIRKDKSLSYSIIYAMDSSLMDDDDLIKDDDKTELETSGFRLEEYNQDNYKGFVISKDFENIDDISVGADVTYNVSGLLDGEANNQEVFAVKKGFLKNIYTAKFTFSANEENDVSEPDENNSDEFEFDDDSGISYELDDDSDISNGLSDSFSQMTNGMDLSFNVKLPYKAISNNATTSNNDNKDLSWKLTSDKVSKIEFSFALYNMTNVYIAGGVLLIIVIGFVVLLLKKRK